MNIKEIRLSKGMTKEKFAQFLGVTLGTIVRWEKGVAKPSPLAMEKLSKLVPK